MKKLIGMLFLVISLTGCQDIRQEWSHTKSSFVGLNRCVTLYGMDGKILRQWSITGNLEDKGGTVRFLSSEGKAICLSGIFVVEEK